MRIGRISSGIGLSIATLTALSLGACAHTGRLAEYDFRDRTVAVVTTAPPHPQVFTGDWFLAEEGEEGGFLRALFRLGSEIVREVQADQARERLDEATESVDVADRMAGALLNQAARILRAHPVESVQGSDFEIEVYVASYGIEADSWDSQARFFLEADLFLLDGETGMEIWRAGVDASSPVNPQRWQRGTTANTVITAAVLASLSVEEMEMALASLADFSAEQLTRRLREALRRARGG
jgi:hypothetical protein